MIRIDRNDLPTLLDRLSHGEMYGEYWIERGGQAVCALVHVPLGWLSFFDQTGTSAHSENLEYSGPEDATTDFFLSNGQRDEYPTRFVYGLETVIQALEHFRNTGERAPFVEWVPD